MNQSRIPDFDSRRTRRRLRVCLGMCALAVGIAGASCAKPQARTAPEGPPLEMPAPPPRVIARDEPLPVAPPELSDPAPPAPSTTRRPVRRPSAEPPQRQDAAPPAEPLPAASAEPREPHPTLRAPGAAEKPVRDRLAGAQRDLARVDYARLSAEGRAQYEQSKRFIQQAEQALKDQNFVFAQTLADKAATLANELLRR